MPWKQSGLRVGANVTTTESRISLGINNLGFAADLEKALGLKTTTTVARVGTFFRTSKNPRHQCDIGWYAIRRDGQNTLGRDITIGETTFALGTTVNTDLDIDIYKGNYSYSFTDGCCL